MSNLELYKNAYVESFEIEIDIVESLEYQSIAEWDSVGHMVLISTLEEKFDIMMDMDDIIDFSGFERGKEILLNYDVKI